MKIFTNKYEAVFKDYSEALSWMEEIGVKISSGRTQHYSRIMSYWKDNYITASDKKVKQSFPDFVSSVSEIHDFIDIYRSFKEVLVHDLKMICEKLQKGVNGPLNASDETPSSTTARNFIFEALVAAKFHKPDKGISTILASKSDTGFTVDKKKIWVECKRVTNDKKIESNVRKASNQLNLLLTRKKHIGQKGIVALDFSKIIHSGDQLFVNDDDSCLQHNVQVVTSTFISQYSRIWQRVYEGKHNRIIGTLLHFSTMATSEERKLLVRASDWGLNPKLDITQYNQNLLMKIAKILN